jgi:hypothetical protein
MEKELGFPSQPSNLKGIKAKVVPSLKAWESRISRQQKFTALRILDFPDALAPKRPILLRIFSPLQSITLLSRALAAAVLIFSALKSRTISSFIEKKFFKRISKTILPSIM